MSDVKHTPGPWKIGAAGDICYGNGDWQGVKLWTGWVEGAWRDDTEAKANAEFIVRAVNAHDDLVAMLRRARQLVDIATDWNLDEVEIDGEMIRTHALGDEFDAAIAKAEGRQP